MKTVKQIYEGLGSVSNPWNKATRGAHTGLTFKDMPMVIIFQRKSIRTFPDNQMVGLYYAQGIDQYLSLPFNSETGQFFKEEVETVTIRENFNDNLITLREGVLANAASGVAREVGRRVKDYAVDTVKSGVRKARLGLGIDKLDTRTPADNLDKTRKDYGGLGTQLLNRADDFVKQRSVEYLNQLPKNEPEPQANTVKENFCNTLYILREQGMIANTANSVKNKINDVLKYEVTPEKLGNAANAVGNAVKSVLPDPVNKGLEAIGSRLDKGREEGKAWAAKKADELSTGELAGRLDTGAFGGNLGKALSGSDDKDKRDAALAQYQKYLGVAFASKGMEDVTNYRSNRAQTVLGHLHPDTLAAKQQAKIQDPTETQKPKTPEEIKRERIAAASSHLGVPAAKPAPRPVIAPSPRAVPKPMVSAPAPRPSYFSRKVREDVNLGTIKKMIKDDISMSNLVFEGEKEISINNRIARKLWELYGSLNNENRKEMVNMLNENATSYRKLINFAMRQ